MDLSLFNPQQREAILLPISSQAVPEILLLAGAGSGKTRVLTYRVAHLISQGIPAGNILAMTFTKKAAMEMQERTLQLVGPGHPVIMSTFHSLCADLLRRFADRAFDIMDDHDQKGLIKTLIKEHDSLADVSVKPFMQWLSFQRSKCNDPTLSKKDDSEEVKRHRLLSRLYYQAKQRMGNCDFDDLLEHAVELLINKPNLRQALHQKWRYILVDEYQDTNRRQAQLLSLLRGSDTQFLQVGDEDQLIYSWRGAEIEHIMAAYAQSQEDRRITCIPLLTNYRCSARILTLANEVVSVNQKRTGKSLNAHLPAGNPVNIIAFNDEQEEATAIAKQLKAWHDKGVAYNEMAVLIRMNRLSRGLERALIAQKIPYHLHNGTAIFDTKEVRLLLNLLWFMTKPNDLFYLQQALDVIKVGIGPAALKKLKSKINADTSWVDILNDYPKKTPNLIAMLDGCNKAIPLLKTGSVAGAASVLLQSSTLLSAFKEEEHERRGRNISLVIGIMQDYEDEATEEGKTPSFHDFQEQRLLNDNLIEKPEKSALHIMSIHKAKGLEFTCGAILGMQDGIFPMEPDSLRDGEEEDIRLAYVAITRFKKDLMITRAAWRVGFSNISLSSCITGPHESVLKQKGVIRVEFK